MDNYFKICDFMITDLQLKGNDLLIYGLIYSFSANDNNFIGSREYIATKVNCTLKTVQTTLNKFVKNGLIEKTACKKNGFTCISYKTIRQAQTKEPIQEPTQNKTQKEKSTIKKVIDVNNLVEEFTQDEELKKALKEYIEYKKENGKELNKVTFSLQLKELRELTADPLEMTKIVKQTIIKNWAKFYPIKKEENTNVVPKIGQAKQNRFNNFGGRNYTAEQLAELEKKLLKLPYNKEILEGLPL